MKLHRYRRYFQTFFLLLFFGMLTLTVWPLGSVHLGAFLLADPLIALNSIAGGIFKWEMLTALLVVALTVGLGRVFCGYVCPLGFIIELLAPRRQPPSRTKAAGFLRKLPIFIVIGSVALMAFGSAFYLVFDPLSMLTRTSTVGLYPLIDRIVRVTGDVAYLAPPFRPAVDAVTTALTGRLVYSRPLSYQLQLLVVLMFGVVVGTSIWRRRLWCRHLCPLGALLGQMGRFAVFGRVVDETKCTNCLKCEAVCPMDAVDDPTTTDKTRCQLGFECADACPDDAIRFGPRPRSSAYSPSRRTFVAVSAGALLTGFFVNTSFARQEKEANLVRPPGAPDEDAFLGLCSRCGQCMKVCPTNVLQPSLTSAGIEGIFTPHLNFTHGFCDWSCNECGKVCPTGAIKPLALDIKRKTVIGRAYIDRNRCMPWADFTNCIVCQELCPIPNKAIVLREEAVEVPAGTRSRGAAGEAPGQATSRERTVTLKRPHVVAERCIGCGICEFRCPVPFRSAIEVRATRLIAASRPPYPSIRSSTA